MKVIRRALPLALVALLAACGGTGTTPTPPVTPPTTPPVTPPTTPPVTPPTTPPPPSEGTIAGTWTGTTTTEAYGVEQTTFTFSEESGGITGTLQLSGTDGTVESPVSGTLTGTTVNVVAVFTLPDGAELDYVYEGTLSGTTLSGTVYLIVDSAQQETGQFSVTQTSAASLD